MAAPSLPLSGNVTEIILESISDGVFTVDHNWTVTSFNRAAESITGIPRHEAIGRFCWEVFRSTMCETGCPLQATLEQGSMAVNAQTKPGPHRLLSRCVRQGVRIQLNNSCTVFTLEAINGA